MLVIWPRRLPATILGGAAGGGAGGPVKFSGQRRLADWLTRLTSVNGVESGSCRTTTSPVQRHLDSRT